MSRGRVFAFACAALLVAASQAAWSRVCGGSPPAASAVAVRDPTLPPLFVFDDAGRLYRAGFDGRPWELLLDSGLGNGVVAEISANSRWIVFGAQSGIERRILDTATGASRRLLLPRGALMTPARFSPAGDVLAIYVVFGAGKSGLWFVDPATGKARWAGQPRWHGDRDSRVDLRWARDGKSLFVVIEGQGWPRYRFDIRDQRFSPITGRAEALGDEVFLRLGQPEALAPDVISQSMLLRTSARSSDRRMHAWIDAGHVLRVRPEGGASRDVARGSYSPCMGSTIFIRGWAGGSRVLVYVKDDLDFAYFPARGTSTRLFPSQARVNRFLW